MARTIRGILKAVMLTAGVGAILGSGACASAQFPPDNTKCLWGVCIASKTIDAEALGIYGLEIELPAERD
jgi:hypothetical protein